jgi:hypothetical protein
MPTWTKKAIDEYATVAGFTVGILFRQINKGNRLVGERMSEQAIYNLVTGLRDSGRICQHCSA